MSNATRTVISGFPYGLITTFPPSPQYPDPAAILRTLKTLSNTADPVDFMFLTPNRIEALRNHIVSTTKDFTPLCRLKAFSASGASLSPSIAKTLIDAGVNLIQAFGSTELGSMMRTHPHNITNSSPDPLRLCFPKDAHLKMDPVDDEARTFEFIVCHGYAAAAQLWGPESHTGLSYEEPFRTNDIFREVGQRGSGDYVFLCRKDDIIASSRGINVNAVGIEDRIKAEDDGIGNVLMVGGKGRPCLALLVQVRDQDDREGQDVQDMVWNAVEKVNRDLRDWERVDRGMVCVLGRGKMMPVTEKGNVKRSKAEEIFAEEIEELYAR